MPEPIKRDDVEELGQARYIAGKHPTLLHTDAYGWLKYNGTFWDRSQANARVFTTVSDTLETRRKAVRSQTTEERIIEACEPSVRNINAIMTHLKAICSTDVEALDAGFDFLNVANGLLDLKTGELIRHTFSQRFTYCLSIPYLETASTAAWETFLMQCVGGGQEVVDFLQLCVGYSLTGHSSEEKMFYVYGPTRSGKGVFTETLLNLLGLPLATEVDFTTFTRERQQDANNFDLAPLKPARFVAASESSKYERLNEAKIKQMTGGNYIRCAFKYGDHFSYRPQYKLWLTSNYDVNADPHDDAVWGRIVRFEFPNSHQGNEDKKLKNRLRTPQNMAGILKWCVQGAQRWYEKGLTIPQVLMQHLDTSRAELDTIAHWLEERIELDDKSFMSNVMIRQSYNGWCEANGVKPFESRQLGRSLARRPGLERAKEEGNRGFMGMRLRDLSVWEHGRE